MFALKRISFLHLVPARGFGAFFAICLMAATLGCGAEEEVATFRPGPEGPLLFDEALWREPPRSTHPAIRWWWPGGAVDAGQLRKEVRLLYEAGFGGLEIQPLLLGLSAAEIANNPAIRTVGSESFLENLRVVLDEADRLGLAVDLTLGSGWPSGGPFVSNGAERQLLMSSIDVIGPTLYEGPIPPPHEPDYLTVVQLLIPDIVGPFDPDTRFVSAVAAQVAEASQSRITLTSFTDVTDDVRDGFLHWDVPEGHWKIFAFRENRTNHRVLGEAYPGSPADALVLDHLDRSGVEELIHGLGDPWIASLGNRTPRAVFVDSFELMAELPWTSGFETRFREMKGYDITPYLPLLFLKGGEVKFIEILIRELRPVYGSDKIGTRVREDYEEVRAVAFKDSFLIPLKKWADERGVSLRLQAHGGYDDVLDAYEIVDIPESEGLYGGGSYDFLKLASSAGHTGGHTLISSESFVGMTLDPLSLSLEDFHLLAGRALSAGVNLIVYHGHPYGYVCEDGKPWYPFSGSSLVPFTSWIDEDHPVWQDLPAFNRELARLSYVLTRGTHKADIACLNSEREYRDQFSQMLSQLFGPRPEQGQSEISLALKRAGVVYDRVSRKGLSGASIKGGRFSVGAALYEGLLLTDLHEASPGLMESIEGLINAGIPVFVLGTLPERARGFTNSEQRDAAVRERVHRIQSQVIFLSGVENLGRDIRAAGIEPALQPFGGEAFAFALDHRDHQGTHILFLFNESDTDRQQHLGLNIQARRVRMLYPESGEIEEVAHLEGGIDLEIRARRSRVLIVEE